MSRSNAALIFSASGLNFLVINIEWNASQDVLVWAAGILDEPQFADCNVILAPHAFVNARGQTEDATQGVDIGMFVDGFVSMTDGHRNVFLTLSGHFATDSGYHTPSMIGERNQLMFDRQDRCDYANDQANGAVDAGDLTPPNRDRVGGATVTILNFDTNANRIHVSTYDVYSGQWRVDTGNQYSVVMFRSPPSNVVEDESAEAQGIPA